MIFFIKEVAFPCLHFGVPINEIVNKKLRSGGGKSWGSSEKRNNGHTEGSERTINTSVIQVETRKLGQRQWR